MRDVRLVGLSEDGSRLVLELPDGEPVSLPLDERVHAALRGDRARLGQLQIEIDSRLRPREIQARIRAGQSLDEVAEAAGLPVDRVLRYASPILHEREHMAQEAAKVGIRQDEQGAVMLLGELVAARLDERGVPSDALEWDAYRRDDGGWEVTLTYQAGSKLRTAQWVYDPARRAVSPDDEEARWLLEEPTARVVTPLRPVRKVAEPDDQASSDARSDDVPEAAHATDRDSAEPEQGSTAPSPTDPTGGQGADRSTAAAPAPAKPATTRARKERASVPSWDEILFGSKKPAE